MEFEPTIEYALESQWPARLLTLGFRPHDDLGLDFLTFVYNGWSILAAWHGSRRSVDFIVHPTQSHDSKHEGFVSVSPRNAYLLAQQLIDFLHERPSYNTAGRVNAIGIMVESMCEVIDAYVPPAA